jgi:hypothetical protein
MFRGVGQNSGGRRARLAGLRIIPVKTMAGTITGKKEFLSVDCPARDRSGLFFPADDQNVDSEGQNCKNRGALCLSFQRRHHLINPPAMQDASRSTSGRMSKTRSMIVQSWFVT